MRQHFIGFALLIASSVAIANTLPLLLFNYTGTPGNAFLGNTPLVIGPTIDANGSNAEWSPTVNGNQPIGLLVGSTANLCYNSTSILTLNSALYAGDIISIFYGQPQSPSGIACGCYGSACAVI